ncbi:MAG: hypothetical protein ACJATI_002611 [Halioglobus sp.]|jgi:hypothetical protein
MELLDDLQIKDHKKPIFSCIAIIMPTIYLIMSFYISSNLIKDESVGNENVMYILTVSFFIIGVCSSVFSFIRREEPRIFRFIGGAINVFLIVLIMVIILNS